MKRISLLSLVVFAACFSPRGETERIENTSQKMATWCDAYGLTPMDPADTFDFYDDRGPSVGVPRPTSSPTANILDSSWYETGANGLSYVGPNDFTWAWGPVENFASYGSIPNGGTILDSTTRYSAPGRFVVTAGKLMAYSNYGRGVCRSEGTHFSHCGFISGDPASPQKGNTRILLQKFATTFPWLNQTTGYFDHIGWTTGRIRVNFKWISEYPKTNAAKGITLFAHYRTEDDLYAATWRQWEDFATLKGKFCTTISRGILPQDEYTEVERVPAAHMTPNVWHSIEFRINASKMQLFLDDVMVIDHSYASDIFDAYAPGADHPWGTFGIRTDDLDIYIDDIVSDGVEPL